MTLRTLFLAAAALAGAGAANAAVVFSDGFAAQAAGGSILNFNAFTNWTVTGRVDLVKSGQFGITCAGGCVDLAGSPGPGSITSSAISFFAGKPVTVSFQVGGNQRNGALDPFRAAVSFVPANSGSANGISGPGAFPTSGYLNMLSGSPWTETIAGGRGFLTYSYSFIANQSGTFTMTFGTSGNQNASVGPLLQSVSVTTAVPEPQSWALLIAGFGMVGATLRRRQAVAA